MSFKRCSHTDCRKKLDITQKVIGLCKCGGCYCCIHRFEHNCCYDYKENQNKNKFIEENKCISKKIVKI